MPRNNTGAPNGRPAGGARIVHNVIIMVAGLTALCSVPYFLDPPAASEDAEAQNLVFVMYAGLVAALVMVATVVQHTQFRDRRGHGLTDDEVLAELEAQFGPAQTT